MPRLGLLVVVVLASSVPWSVRAQASTGGDVRSHRLVVEAAVAGDTYPGGPIVTFPGRSTGEMTPRSSRAVMAPGAFVRLRLLAPRRGSIGVLVDLDVAVRATIAEVPFDDWLVALPSPYVGARIGWSTGGLVARGGLGITLPIGAAQPRVHERAPFEFLARGAYGLFDPWLIASSALAIVLSGDISLDEGWITTGGQIGAAILVGVLPDAWSSDAAGGIAEMSGWFGFRLPFFSFGVLGSGTIMLTSLPEQGSLGTGTVGPFARLGLGSLSIEARTLFAPLLERTAPSVTGQILVAAGFD